MKNSEADQVRALDAENRWLYFRRHIGLSTFIDALRKFFTEIS
jgi:hypothetical protein